MKLQEFRYYNNDIYLITDLKTYDSNEIKKYLNYYFIRNRVFRDYMPFLNLRLLFVKGHHFPNEFYLIFIDL